MLVVVFYIKIVWRWVGIVWRNCFDCTIGIAVEVRFLLWLVFFYGKLICLKLVFVECILLFFCELL